MAIEHQSVIDDLRMRLKNQLHWPSCLSVSLPHYVSAPLTTFLDSSMFYKVARFGQRGAEGHHSNQVYL